MGVKDIADQTNKPSGAQRAMAAANEARQMAKAAANIAKGAATGNLAGAAVAAGSEFLKNPAVILRMVGIVFIILVLPIMLIAMLPLLVFGAIDGFVAGVLTRAGNFLRTIPVIGVIIAGLFGGGAGTPPPQYMIYDAIAFENAFDGAHLLYNLEQAHEIIAEGHMVQYEQIIFSLREHVNSIDPGEWGKNRGYIIGIDGNRIHFNSDGSIMGLGASTFNHNTVVVMGMYSASLFYDVETVSLAHLRTVMTAAHAYHALFDYSHEIEETQEYYFPVAPSFPGHDSRCGCTPITSPTQPEWDGEYLLPFSGIVPMTDDCVRIYDVVPSGWSWSSRAGGYVASCCQWFPNEGVYRRPEILVDVYIHHFTIISLGDMVFAEIFGIADNEELMTFAHEYARNLMMLLTDTDMGGWFGVIIEAGIVEGFQSPFPGMNWRISSPFGFRGNPFGGGQEFHEGIDIPMPLGTPIRATADGVVTLAQFSRTAGNWIIIDHGYIPGWGHLFSEYMHNSRNLVAVGQRVEMGQVIAEVGSTGRSTGPHVCFRIRRGSNRTNDAFLNPVAFIGAPPGSGD